MKKQTLIRIAILAALTTQISHCAWVFTQMSKENVTFYDRVIPYIFAVSLELSIYLFTIYGRKAVATWFAGVSFLINMLYYWTPVGFDFKFCASVIISAAIPVTIWFYSELLKVDIKKDINRKAQLNSPKRLATKKKTTKKPVEIPKEAVMYN